MSKLLVFFIALSLITWLGCSQITLNQKNLIINGDFSDNSCIAQYCVYSQNNSIPGWSPQPQIEIGRGGFFSDYMKNERVLDLAPLGNNCFFQKIKDLSPGTYELKFQHFARKGVPLDSSDFSVLLNGFVLRDIKHTNFTLNVETIKIPLWTAGDAKLSFCTTRLDPNPYGALLKSVNLVKINDYPIVPQNWNWINNGNFTYTNCKGLLCLSDSIVTVPGWIPEREIEIGTGAFFTDFVKTDRVVELDDDEETCIYQMIKDMQPGTYELKIDYLAKKDKKFQDCQFEVLFNDALLKRVKPSSYKMATQTISIPVANKGYGKLSLCSVEVNDGQEAAALMRSISLVKKGDLPVINQQTPILASSTNQSLILRSHSGSCYQRKFQTQGGAINLDFGFQILSNLSIKQTVTYVTINSQPVYKVLSSYNGRRINLQGSLTKGNHTVGFCPVGSPIDQPHEILISDISVSKTLQN